MSNVICFLLDNNVLASKCYDRIIDEIKACGFQKVQLICRLISTKKLLSKI